MWGLYFQTMEERQALTNTLLILNIIVGVGLIIAIVLFGNWFIENQGKMIDAAERQNEKLQIISKEPL